MKTPRKGGRPRLTQPKEITCRCGCGTAFVLTPEKQWQGAKGYLKGHHQRVTNPSKDHKGTNHPQWAGGLKIKPWRNGKSRAYVWLPHDYPNRPGDGYMLRSRWVMSQYLGRALIRGETVHHINNDTLDDRISNLKLYSSSKEHLLVEHLPKPETFTCSHCGAAFRRRRSYSPKSEKKFCNLACYNAFRAG